MKRLNKKTRLISLLILTFIFWSIWNTYRSIDVGEKKLTKTLRRNDDYVSIFVADISRNVRRRERIERNSVADDALLQENLKVCAHCNPGGKEDGGVDLDESNGFCTACKFVFQRHKRHIYHNTHNNNNYRVFRRKLLRKDSNVHVISKECRLYDV